MNVCLRNVEMPHRGAGFTLTEIMMAVLVFSIVVATAIPAYITFSRYSYMTTVSLQSSHKASMAMERMVYGVGLQNGLRSALATSVVVTAVGSNWTVSYRDVAGQGSTFGYNGANRQLVYDGPDTTGNVVIGDCITSASVSNASGGLFMQVTAVVTNGRFKATNTMTTFVGYRNKL
jgi:prepilin-type N-terminal cleavage/methylation domain-containing protein